MKNKKLRIRILYIVSIVAFSLVVAIWLYNGGIHSKGDTIIHSGTDTIVTMPSGNVVPTNEWFTRDPNTELALQPLGNSNDSFLWVELFKNENKALIDFQGSKVPLIVSSITSSSSGSGSDRVIELAVVVHPETFEPEPVGI